MVKSSSELADLENRATVEYRLIKQLGSTIGHRDEVFLAKTRQSHLPQPGQLVNIQGNPFIAYDIASATDEDGKDFWYVGVFKAGSYNLRLGGRSY